MKFTLLDLWYHMGVGARLITLTMILMSIASIVVACERVVVLVLANKKSVAFARRLAALLGEGDLDHAAAQDIPEAEHGHLGRVLSAGLRVYRSSPRGDVDFTFESVARVLERQSQREVHNMKRGVGVLANVASTAPFVGLLGTVLGIVNAFQMMSETGSGGLATVSGGIAEALATTALGLLVAIPSIAAYNGLSAWIDARAVDLAEASNELLDLLARHQRVAKVEPHNSNATVRTHMSAVGER